MSETIPTWSFTVPDEGAAFPEHLVEAVWSWLRGAVRRRSAPNPSSSLQRATQNTHHLRIPGQFADRGGETGSIPRALRCRPREARGEVRASPGLRAWQLGRSCTDDWHRVSVVVGRALDPMADPLIVVGICDPGLSLHKDGVLPRWDDLLFHAPRVRGLMLSVFGPGSMRVIPGRNALSNSAMAASAFPTRSTKSPISESGITKPPIDWDSVPRRSEAGW